MLDGILNTAIITTSNIRIQGEWHGRGSELFGLRGEVTREQFEAIREGQYPGTGEFLRPRHSADRTTKDGNEQSRARSLYDLTFPLRSRFPFRPSLAVMSGWQQPMIRPYGRPLVHRGWPFGTSVAEVTGIFKEAVIGISIAICECFHDGISLSIRMESIFALPG
jgi:TrwC relaxase